MLDGISMCADLSFYAIRFSSETSVEQHGQIQQQIRKKFLGPATTFFVRARSGLYDKSI